MAYTDYGKIPPTVPDEGAQVVAPVSEGNNLQGALSAISGVAEAPRAQGALSSVPQREPFDLQKMISQYAPQDDSSSKYFAMAAALGKPTRFGSLGEVFGNVASALQEHKQNQEKLRAQYVPIIMQQVAAQQAREEQAAYRMEAQKAQMAAAQQARDAQQAFAQQQQAERLAQQAQLAQQHDTLMRTIAGNKPEPAPQIIDRPNGVFSLGRDGQLTQLIHPITGKPLSGKGGAGGEGTAPGTKPILGVPMPSALPWANQSNPKDADRVKAQQMVHGQKKVDEANAAATQEEATADQLKLFMELNKRVQTGGLSDKNSIGQFVQGVKMLNPSAGDYATMQSISSEIVPKMRPVGSGTSSDLDIKMFSKATVGVDKPKEANDNIALAVIQRAKNARDYADFKSTYLAQNYTLQDVDKHWNKYLRDNPIFDHTSTTPFTLNPKRVEWTDYFAGNKKAPPAETPFGVVNPDHGWDEPANDVVGKHLGGGR